MDKVRDIARIRDISDRSISTELPDVDNPEGLEDCAKLIHEKVKGILDRTVPTVPVKHRNGCPGRHWHGRMRLEVMFDLWPRLQDPVLVSEELRNDICGKLYDYLRSSGAMICVQRTNQFNPAVWWVNNHWTPMQVSHISDREDPAAVEEAAPEADGAYPCRDKDCTVAYTTPSGRSGHEFNVHRMVAKDETPLYLDDPGFTAEYIVDTIVKQLREAAQPLTFNGVATLVYNGDPRIGKTVTSSTLDALLKTNVVRLTNRGRWQAYELVPKGEEAAVATTDLTDVPVEDIEVAVGPSLVDMPLGDLLEDMRKNMAQGVTYMNAAMVQIKSAQSQIAELTFELDGARDTIADLRRQLAGAKMQNIQRGGSGGQQELEQKLAEVTRERDEFEQRLKTLREAIFGPSEK